MADNRMAPVSAIELAGGPGAGPVVEPRNTALLADMFRQGQISVDDIVQGIDRHQASQTQNASAAMALQEASSPDAVALRQTQAKLGLSQAQGALKLQPLQQQATEIGLKGMVWASKLRAYNIAPESVVQLVQEGFNPPMDFNREPTEQDAALIRTMLQQSADFHAGKARQKELEKEMNAPQTFRSPDGQTVMTIPTFEGKQVSQQDFNQTMADFGGFVRPGDWVKAGGRKPTLLFPGQPGAVGQAPPSVAPPAVVPQAAGPAVAPQAAPVASATRGPVVQPRGATAQAPVVSFDNNGMTVHFPPPLRPKDPTEAQQKSASALTRMVQGEQVFDRLAQKGFDPTSFMAWTQGLLPNWTGKAKGEDVRSYAQAADNWVQGLLRLESGAAIAYKEQKWYVNTFFPQVGDSAAVVAQKKQARQAMADFLNENVGRLTTPETQAQYEQMRNQLQSTATYSAAGGQPIPVPGQPGQPRHLNPPVQVAPITLSGNRRLVPKGVDANGQQLWDWEPSK